MQFPTPSWHLNPQVIPPDWLVELLQQRVPSASAHLAAQLLTQRGLHDPQTTLAFLDPEYYQPTSAWAFGEEMEKAIARLQQARDNHETVYIWGDFDADGITATAVLWEGLGQFFIPHETLHFFIPNRLKESHGLSIRGLDEIATQGAHLIITCDTGSSNALELEHAQALGLDVIITDHHTLPVDRPTAIAFINSRTFPQDHPLGHLSGVAVAYKLVEALYETLPHLPQAPLEALLDLVAIGLIADLVQLKGDCRYLAQKGLARLKEQLHNPTRPGVATLLKLCQKTGDRPTDISFGLGPRINALSRIHGEAREGVELLTSRDPERAGILAESAEWTNGCRKEVQQQVLHEAEAQLARLDLDANPVIVLSNPQWAVGVLGLVASQLAQTYGRPAILLSESLLSEAMEADYTSPQLARGSARSVMGIDLYDLMQRQAHLLHRFGGHPFAAGLSLPMENLSLFISSLHQDFRQRLGQLPTPTLAIDLEVCLADIVPDQGSTLFRALLQLEPYGIGNPAPRLLIRNCWVEQRRSDFSQAFGGRKLKYQKTRFELGDESTPTRFPGVWWGHDAEEFPEGRCDVVIELDYGQLYKRFEYHARLVAVRPADVLSQPLNRSPSLEPWLLDWRSPSSSPSIEQDILRLEHCPNRWDDLDRQAHQATNQQQKLALAYTASDSTDATLRWQQLVGLAKYAARTQAPMPLSQVQAQLQLSARSLLLGLKALKEVGFKIRLEPDTFYVKDESLDLPDSESEAATVVIKIFLSAIAEEQFQQTYFQRAPVQQLQKVLEQHLQG
jgi:single-stranded-DNA-specific exonuclease